MGTTFATDWDWQLKFQPAVREIVTDAFGTDCAVMFTSPESEDDRQFNTDAWLMVDGHARRMSMRLRRYLVGDDFTLRYVRPGSLSEWAKVWAGFGDYLFYGQGIERDRRVERWFIGRMNVFRDWAEGFLRNGDQPPHHLIENRDHSSSFVAFSRGDLPAEFVVAEDTEADLRDAWWAIVRDSRGMESTGHGAAVRWARAGLGLDQ